MLYVFNQFQMIVFQTVLTNANFGKNIYFFININDFIFFGKSFSKKKNLSSVTILKLGQVACNEKFIEFNEFQIDDILIVQKYHSFN